VGTWHENVVGARELNSRLGTYLQRVREGRTPVVTDRGEPVAELCPLPSDDSMPSVLLKLSTKGAVTLPTSASIAAFRPIRSRGSVSDAVREDREDPASAARTTRRRRRATRELPVPAARDNSAYPFVAFDDRLTDAARVKV
jgi:prevent-host-death family protein